MSASKKLTMSSDDFRVARDPLKVAGNVNATPNFPQLAFLG
jgi:hypothetical protein